MSRFTCIIPRIIRAKHDDDLSLYGIIGGTTVDNQYSTERRLALNASRVADHHQNTTDLPTFGAHQLKRPVKFDLRGAGLRQQRRYLVATARGKARFQLFTVAAQRKLHLFDGTFDGVEWLSRQGRISRPC